MKPSNALRVWVVLAGLMAVGQHVWAQNAVTHYPPVGQNQACAMFAPRNAGRLDLIGQTCASGHGEYLQRFFNGQWNDRCGAGKTLTGLHSIRCVDGQNSVDKRPRAQFFARGCCAKVALAPHSRVSSPIDLAAQPEQAVPTSDVAMGGCSAPPLAALRVSLSNE